VCSPLSIKHAAHTLFTGQTDSERDRGRERERAKERGREGERESMPAPLQAYSTPAPGNIPCLHQGQTSAREISRSPPVL